MQTRSTPGHLPAMLTGLVFLGGTLGILFEDVVRGAPFALKHWITITVLAGTILAGHHANAARAARHWLSAGGFTLVFLAGTGLVVVMSTGRQAADTIQTSEQIKLTAERRLEISKERKTSADMLAATQKRLKDRCVDGKGSRDECNGLRASLAVYTAAVKGHDADFDKLGAPRVAAPEAEHLAEVLAVVFGADKAKAKAAIMLLKPFLTTLFLEFGSIVSFGYAGRSYRAAPRVERPAPTLANLDLRLPAPVEPEPMEPEDEPEATGQKSKRECLADLLTQTALGREIPSQEYLRERWGMTHKGTVSKWLAEWERQGLITRTQDHRCKVVSS